MYRGCLGPCAAVLLTILPACGDKQDPVPDPNQCQATGTVTYAGQIQSLVATYCLPCHTVEGRVEGGLTLDTYAEVAASAASSNDTIQAGTMPPATEPPMAKQERCLFQSWVDQGSPENGG